MPHRQSHQFRIVQNGHIEFFAEILFHVFLARVQIHLAHGAADNHAVRSGFLRFDQNLADQLLEKIHARNHQAGAATVGFVGPLNRLDAQLFQKPVHMHGIFVILDPGKLWGADGKASVVADRFKPGERLYHLFLHFFHDRFVAQIIHGKPDRHLSLVREADLFPMLLDFDIRPP